MTTYRLSSLRMTVLVKNLNIKTARLPGKERQ